MTARGLPWLSFLDALRPDPGWNVDVAILATYSADCASIVAAMLALAGRDDDRGSGSKVDFAEAFNDLRGRLHVLVQSGRLAVPRKRLPVLRLLDRIVIPVVADEREHSWHPKLALLRFVNPDEKRPQWRLWVSSRNLTRDTSLDMGFLIVGARDGTGVRIKGAEEVGRKLLTRVGHDPGDVATWCAELRKVAWIAPDGVTPIEISLPGPTDARGFPDIPEQAREIVIVSPFLDAAAVTYFGNAGCPEAKRTLVSSATELMRLAALPQAALQGYSRLSQFDAPPPEAGDPEHMGTGAASEGETDDEWQASGLHAKIVMAKTGHAWTAWIGSTNATARGWKRNHELVMTFACTQRVAEDLFHQLDLASELSWNEHETTPVLEDEVERRLKEARDQLLNEWIPELEYVASEVALKAKASPPIAPDLYLEVGWLGGTRRGWTSDTLSLSLPHGADEGDCELFEFALRLDGQECAWVQRVAWDLPEDRDERVMARFLDHRTFMQWLRDLLTHQALTDGGGDWDGEPVRRRHGNGSVGKLDRSWIPTLEEVLRASIQQPLVLESIDRRLRAYLVHLPIDIPIEDRQALKEFEEVWRMAHRELVGSR